MDRVLIIGASGLVGAALKKKLTCDFHVEGTYLNNPKTGLKRMDMWSISSIENVFQKICPEIVILTAAYTDVEGCEENPALAEKTNIYGTQNVVYSAKRHKSKLVFFSTDYIFDGKNGPYIEDAEPHPLSVYGRTKFTGEEIVKREIKDYLIIRTAVVYDYDLLSKNLVMQLVNRLKKGEVIRVPQDQYGNPTLAEDLAGAVRLLLVTKKTGIFNVVGKDYMSRYAFACLTARILGLNEHLIQPVETSGFRQKALRPLRGGLRIEKLERETGYKMLCAEEGLKVFNGKMGKGL